MPLAFITLLTSFVLAGVGALFSIAGIMAIYAGAPFHAAIVMGVVLEIAKLVTISWVYRNWSYVTWRIRLPFLYFVFALMSITSIGTFGFLTKSHLDQGASTIDNSAKVERLDQQITREKSVITDNEKVISQLDGTINSFIGKDQANRAVTVRRSQATQRKQLRDDIDIAQKKIDTYSDEKLKLQSEVRALQLEVGPIKYLAELFSADGTSDTKKIETAIKLFTLLIVSTLDPLAVMLLIAANHTLLRLRREKETETNPDSPRSTDGQPSDELQRTESSKQNNDIGSELYPSSETPYPTIITEETIIADASPWGKDTTLSETLQQTPAETIDVDQLNEEENQCEESSQTEIRTGPDILDQDEEVVVEEDPTPAVPQEPVSATPVPEITDAEKETEFTRKFMPRPDVLASSPAISAPGYSRTSETVDRIEDNPEYIYRSDVRVRSTTPVPKWVENNEKDQDVAPTVGPHFVPVRVIEGANKDVSQTGNSGKYPRALSWLEVFKDDNGR